MTAEIAIMNLEAVALAADSAVTLTLSTPQSQTHKVLTSANKIFALSKYEPVAAMIYANASMMGVPWETILKLYREELGASAKPRIADYAADVLRFLREHKTLFPSHRCELFFEQHLIGYLVQIKREFDQKTKAGQNPDLNAIATVHLDHWKQVPFLSSAAAKDVTKFASKNRKLIDESIDKVFAGIAVTTSARKTIAALAVMIALKCAPKIPFANRGGLVIAGFGKDEFFPSLRSFSICGIFEGHLNQRADDEIDIGLTSEASIVPFAQQDVVYAFMEGVEFQYQREIERATAEMIAKYPGLVIDKCNFLDDATKRKIKSEFANQTKQTQIDCIDAMRNYRAKNYWQPIVNLVAMLPKSELATLAESMVNLTSLRRKVSAGIETVGGPVDVAMISRGEGLIWIKRKHYFQPELNHHFFANYYRNKQETSNATKS